jgi:hypothetical protein
MSGSPVDVGLPQGVVLTEPAGDQLGHIEQERDSVGVARANVKCSRGGRLGQVLIPVSTNRVGVASQWVWDSKRFETGEGSERLGGEHA